MPTRNRVYPTYRFERKPQTDYFCDRMDCRWRIKMDSILSTKWNGCLFVDSDQWCDEILELLFLDYDDCVVYLDQLLPQNESWQHLCRNLRGYLGSIELSGTYTIEFEGVAHSDLNILGVLQRYGLGFSEKRRRDAFLKAIPGLLVNLLLTNSAVFTVSDKNEPNKTGSVLIRGFDFVVDIET